MTNKSAKKKSDKSGNAAAPKEKTATAAAGSAVIPFNPLSAENLRNFAPATPSFTSPFESMETFMNNYKEQYEKFSGDAAGSMRQGIESCVKCSTSLAKGAEQMFKTMSEIAQESSQRNSEAYKALLACRTLNELAEAQNKLMQQNFDEAMSTATKLSEMAIKICNEACEPLNGQMTKTMKKMSESMAA